MSAEPKPENLPAVHQAPQLRGLDFHGGPMSWHYVGRMRTPRQNLILGLALAVLAAAAAPASAQRAHHGRRHAAAASTPANASAAVCRTRARDYAYEKHADVGQERMFFNKCVGQ